MPQYSAKQIKRILKSKELADFLFKKVYQQVGDNARIRTPRKDLKDQKNARKIRVTADHAPNQGRGFYTEEKFLLRHRDSVVAGGSICAWVNEYFYGVHAKINDVDLFTYEFGGKTAHEVSEEIYSNLNEERFNYQIEKVTESGILNTIEIYPNDQFTWEDLLESFDLDCCQVGINLSHGSIFFTREFWRFLCTQVIGHIENEDEFPLTSFIRGQVKSQELQASYYMGEHVSRFVLENLYYFYAEHPKKNYIRLIDNKDDEDSSNEFVTKKRLKTWKDTPFLLSPYLELSPKKTMMTPGDGVRKQAWFDFFRNLAAREFTLSQGDKSKISLTNGSTSFFDFQTFSRKIRIQERLLPGDIFKENKSTLKRLEFYSHNLVFNNLENLAKIYKSQPELFRANVSLKDSLTVSEFLNQHPKLLEINYRLMSTPFWTLSDMNTFWMKIKREDLALVGVLENLDEMLKHFLPAKAPEDWWDYDSVGKAAYNRLLPKYQHFIAFVRLKDFEGIVNHVKIIFQKQVKTDFLTIPVAIKPFSKWVKEIVTQQELTKEGNSMRHCVGGYGNAIKYGTSRIFHIHINGHNSTLQVNVNSNPNEEFSDCYYLKIQHKGTGNSDPKAANEKVADLLINYLNNYDANAKKLYDHHLKPHWNRGKQIVEKSRHKAVS